MHYAFRALMRAAFQDASKSSPTADFSQAAAKAAFSYALVFLLPVNGSVDSPFSFRLTTRAARMPAS